MYTDLSRDGGFKLLIPLKKSQRKPLRVWWNLCPRPAVATLTAGSPAGIRGADINASIDCIDFKREKIDIPAKVAGIEYDPNRTTRIALLHYADGEKRYILAPLKLKVGDLVISSAQADIKPGNSLPIANIPLGTHIHNIELRPGCGGQLARSAGTYAQLMAKEEKYAQIKLPSGEVRKVLLTCRATIGQCGHLLHERISLGKAGRSRWLGKDPRFAVWP